MFVYYYVHVNLPFRTVEERLLELLAGLDGMASDAYRDGERLGTRIGIGSRAEPFVAKRVAMHVGEPFRGPAETEVPIVWNATGTPGLFPSMDAGIVVAALGSDMTQVALRGSYDPPLGMFGKALDRTIFHRIAEASVKGFVDRLARCIGQDEEYERVIRDLPSRPFSRPASYVSRDRQQPPLADPHQAS